MSRFGIDTCTISRCILSLIIITAFFAIAADDGYAQGIDSGSSQDGEWKGVPDDFPVTRWPEDSPIRPIRFDQWKARQAPAAPLETELISRRSPSKNAADRGLFVIIVNFDLQTAIQTSLDQYIADLITDGYEVEQISASGGTPEEFRDLLYDKYTEGMQGTVLIGDLPIAWYEINCWDPIEHEEFPCDLYYMDLDGGWGDSDGDGIFDSHYGAVDPEIWVGRLTASPMGLNGADEATLVNNYFRKNHLYRIGQLPLADRALLYIDDDWQYDSTWWGDAVGLAYPSPTVIADPYETVAEDYEDHLDDNYELVQVCAHSDPHTHYFSTPSGSGGTTSVGRMVTIDPQAVFYNLFACSNARYVENDYMAGWYIFCQTFGLASVGSTKTGSMLNFHDFYGPFASGRTIGEAFFDWFTVIVWDGMGESDICWFYGMTLCGDPTLLPGLSSSPELLASDLSDVVGDGDYVLEQGETVECRFAFKNIGAATASDVEIGFYINDAAITILDDYAYIGDIGPGSVGTNDANPLIFSIPSDYTPRVDSIYVNLIWNGGLCVDTIAFEQALGGAEIILVDDDDNDVIDQYYIPFLENSFIPYHLWDEADSFITASALNEYDVAVWLTGGYRADLINSAEITAMTGYMDNGGNLFLTGQGIAEQLNASQPDFLGNYLRSEYLSTSYLPLLIDIPGGQVFEFVDSICITGVGGPTYQTNCDQIGAINGGVDEIEYMTEIGSGGVSYAGAYKTVFFSFGFESALNGNSRWVDRDSLYGDILDFFEYSRPSNYPEVTTVEITPGDPMCMIDHTPEISWTYFDPGANPQSMYHVQVGSDDFWGTAEMWDTGPISGTETTRTYDGLYLECGERYYFRVRVFNGILWSAWTTTYILMNAVPVPTGMTPCNMDGVYDFSPDLTHDNMIDPEGSPLVYTYELYEDAAMTTLLAHAEDQPAGGGGTTSWPIPITLSAEEDYYWRVHSRDTIEAGRWSGLASFVVFPTDPVEYICGDANDDESVNIGDAVFLISYIFKGGPPPQQICVGDANGDGDLNVGDIVYLVSYVFNGGPAPVTTCCP